MKSSSFAKNLLKVCKNAQNVAISGHLNPDYDALGSCLSLQNILKQNSITADIILEKPLENFLNIDINYYARVNFTSLIQMVDALGGIEVYSDQDIPKLGIHEGINQMDGKKALSFSRERYSYKSGDNHRVQNQQKVLEAMLNKMMSPAIITNYSSILDHIDGCFETNMTSDEITSLIKMQLSDMSSWDIQQIQLQGHGAMLTGGAYMPGNRLYYMIPDEESVSQCVAQIKEVQENH